MLGTRALHIGVLTGLLALAFATAIDASSAADNSRKLLAASPVITFQHGVASGDPYPTSIVLWTRVTLKDPSYTGPVAVSWVVSTSKDLTKPVAKGSFTTSAERDFTVKVIAGSLRSGVKYYFGFTAGKARSMVGTFKLPPAAGTSMDSLKYAIVSCSNWGWGYFNAYDAMSKIQDLDLWIHLGDLIYEYGPEEYPTSKEAVRPAATLSPQHTLVTLQDYRQRHALYRTDSAWQALAAKAPLVAVWDDHEIADNAWTGSSSEHNTTTDGAWSKRVDAAVRAYHEWLPTRYLLDDSAYKQIYRSFEFGNLATLIMAETRLTARTNGNVMPDVFGAVGKMGFAVFPPDQVPAELAAGAKKVQASYDAYRNQKNLTVIGGVQMKWISDTVKKSVAAGTTWQLFAQDTVMLEQLGPDFDKAIAQEADASRAAFWKEAYTNVTDALNHTAIFDTTTGYLQYLKGMPVPVSNDMKYGARIAAAIGKYKINSNFDSWAGYQQNKKDLLKVLSQAKNAVIYGGDSHNAWAGVESLNGKAVAAEFDGAAVTSTGYEAYFGFIPPALMAKAMVANNAPDGMKYAEMNHKGYMLATLTHKTHHLEYIMVDTITTKKYTTFCDAAFAYSAGNKASFKPSTCA